MKIEHEIEHFLYEPKLKKKFIHNNKTKKSAAHLFIVSTGYSKLEVFLRDIKKNLHKR